VADSGGHSPHVASVFVGATFLSRPAGDFRGKNAAPTWQGVLAAKPSPRDMPRHAKQNAAPTRRKLQSQQASHARCGTDRLTQAGRARSEKDSRLLSEFLPSRLMRYHPRLAGRLALPYNEVHLRRATTPAGAPTLSGVNLALPLNEAPMRRAARGLPLRTELGSHSPHIASVFVGATFLSRPAGDFRGKNAAPTWQGVLAAKPGPRDMRSRMLLPHAANCNHSKHLMQDVGQTAGYIEGGKNKGLVEDQPLGREILEPV
jgi:hypothetical protein